MYVKVSDQGYERSLMKAISIEYLHCMFQMGEVN